MKVIWLCNGYFVNNEYHGSSWIEGVIGELKNKNEYEIFVIIPSIKCTKAETIKYLNFTYIKVPKKTVYPYEYDKTIESHLGYYVKKINPDVVHIFGAEFPYALSMMKVLSKLNAKDKAVISIQGLCSVCVKHYANGIPRNIINRVSFRDFIRMDNIKNQIKKFAKRGFYETEAIKLSENVIGRTDWDKACVTQINPNVKYYFNNESLREVFYNNEWQYDFCEKHTIFMSQVYYPLKGCHFMLEAMKIIKGFYPNVKLNIAGNNIVKHSTLKDKLSISTYGIYLRKLIKKYDLVSNVEFTGILNAEEMCNQYLKANVFVLASTIENSPNSVGEAMILGVPTISASVGGVHNMLTHNVDGILYQADAPYMLAYYIMQIFENKELAESFSKSARCHAKNTHDKDKNLETMLAVYNDIAKERTV